MKTQLQLTAFAAIILSISPVFAKTPENPKVDMPGFLTIATSAASQRVLHDQESFLKMSAEKGVVVLDARSADKFAMLHVKGAVNLPFTDFTEETLAKIVPDKNTRILIYCNNNFDNAPRAMPMKMAPASLNLSTLVSLHTYGYKNVHELSGYIDVKKSKLPFAGTDAK